jgi:hypothetical protein
MRQDLVDRSPTGLEALPGCVQIQPPHPRPLRPGEPHGFVVPVLEPPDPVPERFGVVVGETLHVPRYESGAFQRELYAG